MSGEGPKVDERAALIHLLGRISHDLRGPAGITAGVLDELQARAEPNSADKQLFAMARRGLTGVLRIAERLEMVVQLESGTFQLETAPVEIAELLKMSIEEAAVVHKRKAIRTSLDAAPTMRAICDAHWLGVSLVEIVANAIRHAKTSVRVSAEASGGKTKIVVEDDGPGFSPDALAAATEPRFSRVGHRLGLGLSLSIVGDVMRAHKGTLTLGRALINGAPTGARVELELAAP